jgi:hypothetical protein
MLANAALLMPVLLCPISYMMALGPRNLTISIALRAIGLIWTNTSCRTHGRPPRNRNTEMHAHDSDTLNRRILLGPTTPAKSRDDIGVSGSIGHGMRAASHGFTHQPHTNHWSLHIPKRCDTDTTASTTCQRSCPRMYDCGLDSPTRESSANAAIALVLTPITLQIPHSSDRRPAMRGTRTHRPQCDAYAVTTRGSTPVGPHPWVHTKQAKRK